MAVKSQAVICGIGLIFSLFVWFIYLHYNGDYISIPIPMEEFPEEPWRTPSTLGARTVVSTPYARFEVHQVKTESGVVVNDWLWTDERSHVNILVRISTTIAVH
jgi:hypothetical protein